MKIAIYDIDSKIPNLALMKLSSYHKQIGDYVEWYSPLFHSSYDKIYASKIFTFSDNGYIRRDIEIGGSGVNLEKRLPYEIEHIYPDYELYKCKYAIGFMTRGCIRDCPFCIVPKKEGLIKFNAYIEEFTKDQREVKLLDNNILAYKGHLELLKECRDSGKKIDFNQGLDIRLINKENAKIIKEIPKWDRLEYRFAFDDISLEPIIRKKTEILKEVGINRAMFYLLIGFNTKREDDIKRVNILKELGHLIYTMPYNKFDKYQQLFRRWTASFSYLNCDFEEFCRKQKRITHNKKK